MSEFVTSFTSLPNLHPALVHFPIALLPMAVLFDLVSRWRWRDWLARAATVLYAAAALGAGAAFWTGEQAADSLPVLAPAMQRLVNEHSDSGLYTLWLVGLVVAARIALEFWDRDGARTAARWAVLLAAAVGVGLVFRTADLGGGLVYQHGIAVARAGDYRTGVSGERAEAPSLPDEPAATAEAGPAANRLATAPDGALEWRPLAGDGDALGSILKPAPGSDLSTISWLEPETDAPGLRLAVQGEALLVLPGTFGDVQVEAELGLEEFEGAVGVAHHVRGADRAGIFTLEVPANEHVLASVEGGRVRELDREAGEVSSDRVRLTVSAIGRHLKGRLGDRTVVHGHESALPDGACGLFLRGNGTVRIHSMKVTPAGG